MVNVRSLRFRLAAWYFCTVTAIFALAAGGYWLTVRSALHSALDQHLRFRVLGLGEYLEGVDSHGRQEIASRLAQIDQLGELYQVFDADGSLIAQSYNLARRSVRGRPPLDLGSEIRYETGGPPDFPLRLAWRKVTIAGQPLIVGAADPQGKYRRCARRIHLGPAAFNAHHPDARNLLRPVPRAARPRPGRQDYRGCACHHRAQPVRTTGRAGLEG